MKRCNVCQTDLPLHSFSARKASPDGLNYTCRGCSSKRAQAWRSDNPGAFAEWHKKNAEHRSDYFKQWRSTRLAEENKRASEWARNNKPKINAKIAKRNAAKKRAMPLWANQAEIARIYARAAATTAQTGVRHDVDHIVPLQGKNVSGLHWEGNLRVITHEENLRKSNRMVPV